MSNLSQFRKTIKEIFKESTLEETTLTIVWQFAQEDRVFSILTAFRGEY